MPASLPKSISTGLRVMPAMSWAVRPQVLPRTAGVRHPAKPERPKSSGSSWERVRTNSAPWGSVLSMVWSWPLGTKNISPAETVNWMCWLPLAKIVTRAEPLVQ